MKKLVLLLPLFLLHCYATSGFRGAVASTFLQDSIKNQNNFHKLEKLFVTGDFDGDKKRDTLYQHNYSRLEKKEIDFAPDPMKEEWDEVIQWFYEQDADVNLKLNKKNAEVLHLGTAQGLYCLINIGDTNKDGKDEIALVTDRCDLSRVNTCVIYTLCKGKWQLLKEFGVFEGAFDWEGETKPKFNTIPGFLEQQNHIWNYSDYNQNDFDTAAEVGQMKVLKLEKCK